MLHHQLFGGVLNRAGVNSNALVFYGYPCSSDAEGGERCPSPFWVFIAVQYEDARRTLFSADVVLPSVALLWVFLFIIIWNGSITARGEPEGWLLL